MLRIIVKSMPDHANHYRAEINFPRDGREVIIEEAADIADGRASAFVKAEADGLKVFEEMKNATQFPDFVINPVRPVVYHVVDPSPLNKDRVIQRSGRVVDIPGQPVLVDEAAYEYIKVAFGTQLSCEPVGGDSGTAGLIAKLQQLETENAKLKAESAPKPQKRA